MTKFHCLQTENVCSSEDLLNIFGKIHNVFETCYMRRRLHVSTISCVINFETFRTKNIGRFMVYKCLYWCKKPSNNNTWHMFNILCCIWWSLENYPHPMNIFIKWLRNSSIYNICLAVLNEDSCRKTVQPLSIWMMLCCFFLLACTISLACGRSRFQCSKAFTILQFIGKKSMIKEETIFLKSIWHFIRKWEPPAMLCIRKTNMDMINVEVNNIERNILLLSERIFAQNGFWLKYFPFGLQSWPESGESISFCITKFVNQSESKRCQFIYSNTWLIALSIYFE